MKAQAPMPAKRPIPSFWANPRAYGLTTARGGARPNYQAHVDNKRKTVIRNEYHPDKIGRLSPIENFAPECNSLEGVELPRQAWVRPADIWIDKNWQRNLRPSDISRINKICGSFDWRWFKTINLIEWPDGRLFCSDGQKSSIAALYHPDVEKIPALITKASGDDLLAIQAEAFVCINTNRDAIPPQDIFNALLIGGDPSSVELVEILERNKIRPLAANPGPSLLASGDTLCIATLRELHLRRGADWLSLLCSILHEGQYRPVKREHIYAIDKAIDMKGTLDPKRMGQAIRSIVPKHASLEARENARKLGISKSTALAKLLLERYKAGKKALNNA